MKLYNQQGESVPFYQSRFPDGQPHVQVTRLGSDSAFTIESRIGGTEELFAVLLLKDVLAAQGRQVSLDIRYLMGARMDRPIAPGQPFTLQVVARLINSAGFYKVRVFDPHSPMTLRLLGATAVMPTRIVQRVLNIYLPMNTVVVTPDRGAVDRVQAMISEDDWTIVRGEKHRDSETGELSGFSLVDPSLVKGKECLIVDDICDGGGTFVGIAAKLREAGAISVRLYATHGIFSRGTTLAGIDHIFTTDTFRDWYYGSHVTTFIVNMKGLV